MNNGKAIAGWHTLPLCAAAEVIMGSSPPGESYNENAQGVPLINGPVEFSEGDFGLTIRRQYTTEPTKFCRAGDLLLCVRGSTTGRTNIAGFEACIGRGVAAIRAKEHQPFLNHFIRTQRQRLFDLGNGSTFPSITQDQLAEVKVPLPPLPDQRRIATILDKADAIRRKRMEGIRLTEELLRSIFLDMFGDPVVNSRKWPTDLLGTVARLDRGRSRNRPRDEPSLYGGPYPFIQTGDVTNSDGYINTFRQTYSELGLAQSKLWPGGTLCITIAANIAKTAILGIEACFPDSVVGLVAGERLTTEYVRSWFVAMEKVIDAAATQVAQKNINLEFLNKLSISVPPIDIQQKFSQCVRRTYEVKKCRSQAVDESKHLFDTLVQRAFRGEL